MNGQVADNIKAGTHAYEKDLPIPVYHFGAIPSQSSVANA